MSIIAPESGALEPGELDRLLVSQTDENDDNAGASPAGKLLSLTIGFGAMALLIMFAEF